MLDAFGHDGESLYVYYEIDGVELNGPPVVYEGASQGHRRIQVVIARTSTNAATWEPLSFRFATADHSGPEAATAGLDYIPTNGVARMTAAQASTRFAVQILDDAEVEPFEESFNIQFTEARTDNGQPVGIADFSSAPLNGLFSSIRIHDNEVSAALAVGSREPEPLLHFSGGTDAYRSPLRSGRSLVVGEFRAVNGHPRGGVARLLPNGDLDPTFVLDEKLRGESGMVEPPVAPLELRSGGLAWVAERSNTSTGFITNRELIVVGNDGVLLGRNPTLPLNQGTFLISEDTNGQVILHPNLLSNTQTTFRLEFSSDGNLVASKPLEGLSGDYTLWGVQPNGGLLVTPINTGNLSEDRTIRRLLPDGRQDVSFSGVREAISRHLWAMDLDGSFYFRIANWIRRYRSDGSVDPTFPAIVSESECLGGLGILLTGNFLAGTYCSHGVNGVPLPVRLHLSHPPDTTLALFAGTRRPDQAVEEQGFGFWNGSIWDYDRSSREQVLGLAPAELSRADPAVWATFRRLGSSARSASVRFAIRDFTGHAESGFESKIGLIQFAPLEVEQVIKIPIHTEALPSGQHLLEVSVLEAEGFEILPPALIFVLNAGESAPPKMSRVRRLETGPVILEMVALPPVRVEASFDLKHWDSIGFIDSGDRTGVLNDKFWRPNRFPTTTFFDPNAGTSSKRFYRATYP